MAIVLDDRALHAVARRRERGKDDRIFVRLERSSPRTGLVLIPTVSWMSGRARAGGCVAAAVGDVEVLLELRLARYAAANEITISSRRLGPIERLATSDPFLGFRLREWEIGRQSSVEGQTVPTGAGADEVRSDKEAS